MSKIFLTAAALLIAVLIFAASTNEKFWAHRCDSIEKFRLMLGKYSGLELDATFYPSEPRGRKFDVSHDRKSTVEYPLESFMPEIAACDNPIWFDFKNLTAENASSALDELEYLAYETTPMEREKRVELVRQDYYKQKTAAQKEFIDFLIVQYLRNSYYEFTSDNLGKFINMKYGSIADAKTNLAMDVSQIRNQYIEFQRQLYSIA